MRRIINSTYVSLDGVIKDPQDWPSLGSFSDQGGAVQAELLERCDAILMGRGTYDVVAGFEGDWFYGETPLFVVTSRPLDPIRPTVKAISGDATDLVAAVQAEVGDGGIYVDGGNLIRQLLDAGLIDELTVTVIPIILGQGAPLFAGASHRHQLELLASESYDNGLVQLRYEVIV